MVIISDVDVGGLSVPVPAGRVIVGVWLAGLRRPVRLCYMEPLEFDAVFGSTRCVRGVPTYWTEGIEVIELSSAASCRFRVSVEVEDVE